MSATRVGELDATAGLTACTKPLVAAYDVALLDLDGVVNRGDAAVPHAVQALTDVRGKGMRLRFVTNNASRTPEVLARRLNGFGIEVAPDEVVTSAQAAARVLREQLPAGASVLVVGDEGLWEAVTNVGLRPVREARPIPAAVVQGHSPSTGWAVLAEAVVAVREGALWVASNSDPTLPSERGPLPGNGAFVELVRRIAGGEPIVAGKPEPALHRESVEQSGARNPLVVGDRLDTDIEGARRAGSDSLLVLTGVSGPAELLAAAPGQRPNYVAADLRGLLEPHPVAERDAEGVWRLGGWQVGVGTDRLTVRSAEPDDAVSASPGSDPAGRDRAVAATDDGEPVDAEAVQALRTLCVAAWTSGITRAGPDDQVAEAALARLGLA